MKLNYLRNNLAIGIKYCGHCNPQKEGQQIVREILHVIPSLKIVKWTDLGCDVILIISACPVGCVGLPDTSVPWINVVVKLVRNWFIPTTHPANILLDAFNVLGYKFVNSDHSY